MRRAALSKRERIPIPNTGFFGSEWLRRGEGLPKRRTLTLVLQRLRFQNQTEATKRVCPFLCGARPWCDAAVTATTSPPWRASAPSWLFSVRGA